MAGSAVISPSGESWAMRGGMWMFFDGELKVMRTLPFDRGCTSRMLSSGKSAPGMKS